MGFRLPLFNTLEPLKLTEVSVTKNGKLHLVYLLVLFHHCHSIHEGVLVPPLCHLRCPSMTEHPQWNITVQDIVEGQQTETGECIGLGGMAQEQDGHTITKEGDFQAIIIDLKDSTIQDLNRMVI